jgi:uncharacterized membrane protein
VSAQNVLSVRLALLDLEGSIGLVDLSEGERNVLAAIVLSGGAGAMVKPGDLRRHPLAAGLTHPTYHRTLRGLMEKGIIEYKADDATGRGYMIVWDAIMSSPAARNQAAV